MNKKASYTERLKKMKQSIEENKEILNEDFPDDITTIGNPKFIKDEDHKTDEDNSEEESHDQ